MQSSLPPQDLVEANPGVLAEGMFDLQTGVAPLHMAAKAGQLGAMQHLLDLGAGLDWRDGAGLTALQVGFTGVGHAGMMAVAGDVDKWSRAIAELAGCSCGAGC